MTQDAKKIPKYGTWAGGRTYVLKDGSTAYIIRRMVKGKSYNITLDAKSLADAETELSRFLDDPTTYQTKSDRQEQLAQQRLAHEQARVALSKDLIAAFLAYLKSAGRTDEYRADASRYLNQWRGDLGTTDLRSLDAKTTKRLLTARPAKKYRAIVFKSCCSWLVNEGLLDANENPGRHLKVPPSHRKHDAKGYSIATIERLYRALSSQYIRDALCLRALTGMHGSELERLASGQGKLEVLSGQEPIAATATFLHKTGEPHRVSLDAQGLAAAQRLIARGSAPAVSSIQEATEQAAKDAQDPSLAEINFGAIRHSVGTWLAEVGEIVTPSGKGLPVELIAQALGHKSTRTTKLHYLSVKVPPLYRTPIRLEHPNDPPLERNAANAPTDNVIALRPG
jgi:integrase